MNMPNDPAILLSYINTKLRDCYSSFDKLCEDMELDGAEIAKRLETIGYVYSVDNNAFV